MAAPDPSKYSNSKQYESSKEMEYDLRHQEEESPSIKGKTNASPKRSTIGSRSTNTNSSH